MKGHFNLLAGRLATAAIVAIGAMSFPTLSLATVVTATGTITRLLTFPTFGGGDVVVVLSNQPSSCAHGFWLSPTQPGFKNSLAFLLAARAAGDTVLIGGDDAAIWPGSTGSFCKIDHAGTPS